MLGKGKLPSLDTQHDPNADLKRMADMSADDAPAKPRTPHKPATPFG